MFTIEITTVITFLATSIVPFASCTISILTYINNRKKKNIDRQLYQNSINGNNYYIEANRNIEVYSTNNDLVAVQERLTIKQQNLKNFSNFFAKYSFIFMIAIYIINSWNLITPLPAYPLISFESSQESLLGFLASSLYRAIIPTTITLLFLIGLLCFTLVLKNLLLFSNKYTIVPIIYYLITACSYYLSSKAIANIPLEKINITSDISQKLDLFTFFNTFLPFIFLALLIVIFGIIIKLIKILFEFEKNKPNIKLLDVFFPRLGFFIGLLLLSFTIILGTQYI
ncbi:hypothetical protein IGK38_002207 [Enterococcus pernyi]|uniref:hypothetical protein n=1 Tax=Enterococcus mundtii TaxID=53346 RepID=UPI0010BE3648|nr:hypothetical protein [Enterococcus mundtii]QCJ57044.1 hypothetical protein DDJ96_10655 [Enterococcus mundtii]